MLYFEGNYGQDELAEMLGRLGTEIFFVQVGANDGIIDDPIAEHVKKSGWRGLLIEPMPKVFDQLKTNYSSCENLLFENVAITDFEGEIELLVGNAQVGLVYPNHTVASVIREQSFFNVNNPALIAKIPVPCTRLSTVLKKHAVQTIDLFVVDVEGADWIVTRQLSMEEFSPALILMEYRHLTSYERIAFCEHFRNYGYRVYLSKDANNVLAAKWPAVRNSSLMRKRPFVAEFAPPKRVAN